jgi:hypothetical protein
MALSDEQRVRYARHLLLPELGEAGQLRLLASRVRFAEGTERGASEIAGEYLRRAGVACSDVSVSVSVSVSENDGHDHDHAHDHAHDHVGGDVDGDGLLLAPPKLNCSPSLHAAAQALSGAFAAVEAIKTLTGIGQPAQLDLDLLVAEDV